MRLINQRVAWVEGTLLEPQHFQQQERYLERIFDDRARHLLAYGWGFSELAVDAALLEQGRVALAAARGIFRDGTVFNVPDDAPLPTPWEAGVGCAGEEICLVLPLDLAGVSTIDLTGDARQARFSTATAEVADRHHGISEEATPRTATIQVGQLRTRLLARKDVGPGETALAVARVHDRMASGAIRLDPAFVPSMVDAHGATLLIDVAREIHGLATLRLASLERPEGTSRPGNLSDFLELLTIQALSEYRLILRHLISLQPLHPERLFQALSALVGRLAILPGAPDGGKLPTYDHASPGPSFRALSMDLRRSLSLVIESPAIALEFVPGADRYAVCMTDPHWRLQKVVLVARAHMPADRLRNDFPLQAKLGPVETINQLIDLQLPGARLSSMPLPPRHVPYYADGVYFEVESHGAAWNELLSSSAMALSVVGDFPGLHVEAWGLRDVTSP